MIEPVDRLFGSEPELVPARPVIQFHGQIDGRWRLVLKAAAEDIRTIRLVTADEPVPHVEPA